MDCSLPGSSVHGIFQARILEWAAISFSRGTSQPRDRTRVSSIVGRHFTVWATLNGKLHVNFVGFFGFYKNPKSIFVVQLLSCVWLFVTSESAAYQAFLSFTISRCLLKLISTELLMPSNHFILWCPLLLPSIFRSIRVFSNESPLCIRWPKKSLFKRS